MPKRAVGACDSCSPSKHLRLALILNGILAVLVMKSTVYDHYDETEQDLAKGL